MTPKALSSVSLSVSSKKRSYRLTRKLVSFIYSNLNLVYSGWFPSIKFYIFPFPYRDHGVHKLVFERGGLPDGTELGYYARGQVTYLILYVVYGYLPLHLAFSFKTYITVGRNCSEATNWALEYIVTVASVRYFWILYELHHALAVSS